MRLPRAEIVDRSLLLCGAPIAQSVHRYRPISDWEEFTQHHLLKNYAWVGPELKDTPLYLRKTSVPVESVSSLVVNPETVLSVMMPNCPLQDTMGKQIQRPELVPDSARGSACPDGIFFWFGDHDIIDFDLWEDETKTRFICRTFFSMSFSGPGDPADHLEFRRLVRELPVVKETQAALEPIVGPTDILVSYNI